MKRIINKIIICLILFQANLGFLLAEGKAATELRRTVRTDGLSGLQLFLAETYNENRLLYALISTLSVVVFGVIVTYIISKIVKPKYSENKEEI